jgi:anhydro-N-acetylmuramic acid kinase
MDRKGRIVIGLNSGTSADGADAAACEIRGRGTGMKVRVLGHLARPYPAGLRQRILAAMAPAATRTEEICRLETEIGEHFAGAARGLMRRLELGRVDLVGSHGQTICHLPPRRGRRWQARGRARPGPRAACGTMQIGDPAVIACRLGVPVVSHFRQADMAVGGQGAPLVPWTDYLLFHDARESRIILNLGGIANLTWLPAGGRENDVIAFDTGPGNMVMDAMVRRFRGRSPRGPAFDAGGRLAAAGTCQPRVLRRWLAHPFFRQRPPRSCGREEFGEAWVRRQVAAGGAGSSADWLATAAMFTARCVADSCTRFLRHPAGGPARADEVILCGGGAKNRTVVRLLGDLLRAACGASLRVSKMGEHGIREQAKECVSFAMLAAACVDRVPANLPRVTGARRRVVLGQVCQPEAGR